MSLAKNCYKVWVVFQFEPLHHSSPLHAFHHCFSLLYEYSWCLWNTTLYKSVASTGSIESIQHLYHDTIVQRVRSLQFKSVNDSTPVGPVLRWDDHSCEYSSGPLNTFETSLWSQNEFLCACSYGLWIIPLNPVDYRWYWLFLWTVFTAVRPASSYYKLFLWNLYKTEYSCVLLSFMKLACSCDYAG